MTEWLSLLLWCKPNICEVVILWFIIRNIYLVSDHVPGKELQKPLEFLVISDKKCLCYVNEDFWRALLATHRWGLFARGTNHEVRGLELSVTSPNPLNLQGAQKDWRSTQLPMMIYLISHAYNNEVSIKSPTKDRVWRFLVWNTWRFKKSRQGIAAPCTFFIPRATQLFCLAVPEL